MKKVLVIYLLLVCTFPLLAQKLYQVNEVSEITHKNKQSIDGLVKEVGKFKL